MALSELEQITQAIEKSNQILITFPKNYTIDAVASVLALSLILKKQGKVADIVCDGFELPDNLKFLSGSKNIKPVISNLQKFVISVDNKNGEIDSFSYNLEKGKLKIYITPKSGSFESEDVTAESSEYKYDLIITLDAADLESLGEVYQNNTQFFYNTNILNIDHKPDNEHFGQINLVNLNSVSSSGMIYRLINTVNVNQLDADIATCILTGLIAKTKSFKTASVTPQSLKLASLLLEAGAEKDTIIKNLYRSRNIGTMNLWGRVLTRLKSAQGNKLIWSMLSDNDFVEAGATEDDLPDVIDELISFIPGVETIILIYQLGGKNNIIVSTMNNHNALYLTSKFKSKGNKNIVTFEILDKTLKEAETEIIDEIKEKLK